MSLTRHSQPTSNHYLSRRTAYTESGSHSAGMRKTCPNNFNLFWYSRCSKNWTPGPSIWRLIFELLTKILPIIQINWRSNTKDLRILSVFNCHVSQLWSNTDFIVVAYIRRLIDNWMSCRFHRCLKLSKTNWAFCHHRLTPFLRSFFSVPVWSQEFLLTFMSTLRHHAWRRTETVHLAHFHPGNSSRSPPTLSMGSW